MTRGICDERLASLTAAEFENLREEHGSLNKAADALGIPRETFKGVARRLLRSQPYQEHHMSKPVKVAPPQRGVKRFIFSSAQNGTAIDEKFLTNLEAYAAHLGAEIRIAGFTYGKSLFEDHSKSIARYHDRVEPYLTNAQFDIGGRLLFCGEMNILPTAEKPLSGFEAYTRSKWGIFPSPRLQLHSVATNAGHPSKIIMTTGAVTKRNYVQKKAGIKAEFHHVIGAVLVEIDADGVFFCRHLLADRKGNFQDLDTKVEDGKVSHGWRVKSITWADVHCEMLDRDVAAGSWGIDAREMTDLLGVPKSMLDELEPEFQIFHDTLDFRRRNHHSIKDPHVRYQMWSRETECVEDELIACACFLMATRRDWCQSIVVDSNHDRALKRWLREADYRLDPVNARFFLECQAQVYKEIDHRNDGFLLAEWAMKKYMEAKDANAIRFLRNTDSFMVGDVEKALHGDQGANGARGTIFTYARMGPKATIAHTHDAGIFEGIFRVGTSSKLDVGYNRGGLSSWNHTHELQYPNGKRTLITMQGPKWRA
jgi:hypothetical protein